MPVIVVRPSSKRDKKKAKRIADPGRRVYQGILEQSGHIMENPNESRSLKSLSGALSNTSINSDLSGGGGAGGVSPGTMSAGSPVDAMSLGSGLERNLLELAAQTDAQGQAVEEKPQTG